MKRELLVVIAIVASIAGVSVLGYNWFPRRERVANHSPRTPLVEHEVEPDVALDKVSTFTQSLDGKVIAQVQHYAGTSLLYLVVADGWTAMTEVEQKELAIALRDHWKEMCDCFAPILVFKSAGGVELGSISAGQYKAKE